jgi:malonate-semialdehyde dehydrogenase (acetylating)/methylmalonate-semialdehyde dehydrogenase
MQTLHNIIGGVAAKSTSPRSAPIFNPATGEQSAILPLSTAAELDAAVAAAKLALPAWGETPPLKRARFMFNFKQLLDANAERMAKAISAEHGKTDFCFCLNCKQGCKALRFSIALVGRLDCRL